MSGGKAAKRKGSRFELTVVKIMQAHGINARKVPLSGAAEGWKGDISVENWDGKNDLYECKMRRDGQSQIRKWLADNYGLVLGADRQVPLVVLRLSDFCELVSEANTRPIDAQEIGE